MADESLKQSLALRGGVPTRESFPPGSSMLFIDSLTSRSDDVQKVANKAQQAASGAYSAQEVNDRQDIQIGDIDARLQTAESTLQNHEGRIKKNEDDIGQLQTDVSQLQTDVGQLQTDVSILQNDVSAIQADYVSKSVTTPQSIASPLNVVASYSVGGVKVVGPRQTGWTAAGGSVAANIGAWNPSTLAAASATYVQAEATQTRTQLNAAEARIKALEAAMRTHGLIN